MRFAMQQLLRSARIELSLAFVSHAVGTREEICAQLCLWWLFVESF
jgi:hypothetical protein